MVDTFLEDQYKQLNDIFESYKKDIESLDIITRSWEESGCNNEILSEQINSTIVNKASIEIKQNQDGQYLLEMTFHPIKVAWLLNNQKL